MIVCLVLCGNLSSCASFWGCIVFVRSFPRSWKEGRGSGRYNVCEELSWIVQRVMIWQRTKSKHGKKKGSIREKRFCPTHFCENTTHPLGNLTPPPPPKKIIWYYLPIKHAKFQWHVRFPKCPKGTPFYQRPYVPLAFWCSWVVISTLSTFWIMSAGRTPACEHMAENKPRTISPAETDH